MFIFLYKYISVILVRKRKPFIGWSSTFSGAAADRARVPFCDVRTAPRRPAGHGGGRVPVTFDFLPRVLYGPMSLVWERAKGFRLKAHLHQCHRTSHESTRESAPNRHSGAAGWGKSVRCLNPWPAGPTENQTEGNKEAKKRQKESASQSAHTSKAGYETSSWRQGTIPK